MGRGSVREAKEGKKPKRKKPKNDSMVRARTAMAGKLRSPRRSVDPVRRGRARASIGRGGQDRQQKAEGRGAQRGFDSRTYQSVNWGETTDEEEESRRERGRKERVGDRARSGLVIYLSCLVELLPCVSPGDDGQVGRRSRCAGGASLSLCHSVSLNCNRSSDVIYVTANRSILLARLRS